MLTTALTPPPSFQLADWWLDRAYLTYRDSVMINSSPGIAFPRQNFRGEHDHLDYAARLVAGFVDAKQVLEAQCYPVETLGKAPMDMEQFYSLLGTTRIPGRNRDSLSMNPNSKHIVVMHQNNVGKLHTRSFYLVLHLYFSLDVPAARV